MKRSSLLQHLRRHGCSLKREAPRIRSGPIPLPVLSKQSPAIVKFRIPSRGRFAEAYRYRNPVDSNSGCLMASVHQGPSGATRVTRPLSQADNLHF